MMTVISTNLLVLPFIKDQLIMVITIVLSIVIEEKMNAILILKSLNGLELKKILGEFLMMMR